MKKQTDLTKNVKTSHVVESVHNVAEQSVQTYRSPEIVDLGKASKLLQGGNVAGRDNFWQTYYT